MHRTVTAANELEKKYSFDTPAVILRRGLFVSLAAVLVSMALPHEWRHEFESQINLYLAVVVFSVSARMVRNAVVLRRSVESLAHTNMVLMRQRSVSQLWSGLQRAKRHDYPDSLRYLLNRMLPVDAAKAVAMLPGTDENATFIIRSVSDRCRRYEFTTRRLSARRTLVIWKDTTDSQRLASSNIFVLLQRELNESNLSELVREPLDIIAELVGLTGIAAVRIDQVGDDQRVQLIGRSSQYPEGDVSLLERSPLLGSIDVIERAVGTRTAWATTGSTDMTGAAAYADTGWAVASEDVSFVIVAADETGRKPSSEEVFALAMIGLRLENLFRLWRSTQATKASVRRWRRRFMLSPTASAVCTTAGAVLESNTAFRALFPGWDWERVTTWDVLSTTPLASLPPDSVSRHVTIASAGSNARTLDVAVTAIDRGVLIIECTDVTRELAANEANNRLNKKMVALAEDARRSLGEQRRRMTISLHHDVLQHIAALRLDVLRANHLDQSSVERHSKSFDALVASIRKAIEQNRPAAIAEGLTRAIEKEAELLETFGVVPEFSIDLPALPASIEEAVYRIVQEAVANVAVHSEATRCFIGLRLVDHMVRITVTDDGRGFEQVGPKDGHFGVRLMGCTAEDLGGELKVLARAGRGTVVEAAIPYETPGSGLRLVHAVTSVDDDFVSATSPAPVERRRGARRGNWHPSMTTGIPIVPRQSADGGSCSETGFRGK